MQTDMLTTRSILVGNEWAHRAYDGYRKTSGIDRWDT